MSAPDSRRTVLPACVLTILISLIGTTFALDPPSTMEEAKLLPENAHSGDRFGNAVSIDGDTVLVGAYGGNDQGDDTGAAYVFVKTDTGWVEQAELLAADGDSEDYFGIDVELDGDTALIGADHDDTDAGTWSGSAYVFVRQGQSWVEEAKLIPSDAEGGDFAGSAVALDGDTAVVSVWADDDNGNNSGSAVVFVRTGEGWAEQAKLLPDDGFHNQQFGEAVAVDGDTVVVGAPKYGMAYVFVRSGGVWSQQAKLTGGLPGRSFGFAVDVDGNTTVISVLGIDPGGGAHVFTRSGESWNVTAVLKPTDGAHGDNFGYGVAIDGNRVVIGARHDDDDGEQSGSAYLFRRTGATSWSEPDKLLPADGAVYKQFGSAVSIDHNAIAIGAPTDDTNGTYAGAAYIFRDLSPDVPAANEIGLALLLLAVLGGGAYFGRRRRAN